MLNEKAKRTTCIASEHFLDRFMIFGFPHAGFPVLTFDSSAYNDKTDDLLCVLQKHHVRATFFLTGSFSEKNAEVIPKLEALGCEIANHSYSHPSFLTLSEEEIREQVRKTQMIHEKISDHAKKYFRFPFGDFKIASVHPIKQDGFEIIHWSLDTLDWKENRVRPILNRLSRVKNGDIVLMHTNGKRTAKALDRFLTRQERKNQPVRFETVSAGLEAEKSFSEKKETE